MTTSELEQFCDQVSRSYDPDRRSTFWTCEPHFARLLESSFLTDLLKQQLESSLVQPTELILALSNSHARMTMPCGVQLDILLIGRDLDDEALLSFPAHAMIGVAHARDDQRIAVELFKHSAPYRNDVFDKNAVLHKHALVHLGRHQVAQVRAGREVFRLLPVDDQVVVIMLQSKPFLNFCWQYDPKTLRPVQAISPDVAAYRLFYATKLLGAIPAPDNVHNLEKISHHRCHFVRWAAMQALFQLDLEAGRRRLAAATLDPHLRVRNAASMALAQLTSIGDSHGTDHPNANNRAH